MVSVATFSGSPAGHSPLGSPEAALLFADETASLSEHWPSFGSTTSVVMFGWMVAAWAGAAKTMQVAPSARETAVRRIMCRSYTATRPPVVVLAEELRVRTRLRDGREARPPIRAHVHELP